MLVVQSFVNSPVTSNCYVLFDRDLGDDCIIVDPGGRSEKKLIEYLEQGGLIPKYIILTHEHFDHCWGVNELVEKYHIPIICSELCAEAIKNEKRNCSVFYDNKDAFVINNEVINVEFIDFELLFDAKKILFFLTPGHTDASISFSIDKLLFTGDTLIYNEKTVTKLPSGGKDKLKESMKKYSDLRGNGYLVYPGHGISFLLDDYDLMASIK